MTPNIDKLDGETFIPVRDFPKYYVSNFGRFYSTKTNKIIKPVLSKNGYLKITFCDRKIRLAHRVIFEHFVSPIPKGLEINHIDGVKTNNVIENLEMVTPSENKRHAVRMGLCDRSGDKSGGKKVSSDIVSQIRKLLSEDNLTQTEIGNMFGLKQSAVSRIKTNKSWNS